MTPRFFATALAACLGLAATPLAFADDCTATTPATGELIGKGLLDPGTSDAERDRLGKLLLCSALAGNGNSQDVAGSLYRWGPRHPAHVFPQDLTRARDLLTAAAGQGRMSAMLKLAELELADGHAHEAMVWTQVESVFYRRTRPGDKAPGESPIGASYFTMLLKRVIDALGTYDEASLVREVDARVAALDKQIAALPPREHAGPELGKATIPPQQHVRNASPTERDQGAYAEYFVEIGPDGHATRSWLVDAYPDPGSGVRIGRIVPTMHWAALAAGNRQMRYALVPISLGSLRNTVHLQ